MNVVTPLSPEEIESALKIARELVDAGIPVFSAAPDSSKPGQYHLPKAWQETGARTPLGLPNYGGIERWRPGWALGAVGGHAADFLDNDPRNGGRESMKELRLQGQMPRVFGQAGTPSGGEHFMLSPTGERKATGFMPGLDLQSGAARPDGKGTYGRGFVYISPTVRPSKAPETLGQLRPYRWVERPDTEALAEWSGGGDDSTEGVIARVHSDRQRTAAPRAADLWQPAAANGPFMTGELAMDATVRGYTLEQAKAFCQPLFDRLAAAPIGEIEDRCNDAAAVLSHFVPSHFGVDQGMAALRAVLASTAYDESHPASTWTVEKFRGVLDGTRPVADPWRAVLMPDAPLQIEQAVQAAGADEVDALLAEMLSLEQLKERPPKPSLIEGLAHLDSEVWVIGEPGSRKSFVVLDMGVHVAAGRPWQGLRVKQGPVVIIAAEGAGGIGGRVKAWELEHGPLPAGVHVLPRPVQAADVGAWAVLVKACARIAPVMVVGDTQARLTVGLEENSAKDMGIYIAAIGAIKRVTGAAVFSVHHTGRSGGDARGSSAIDGAQDTELKVVKSKEPLRGELRIEKQKDLIEGDPISLLFKVHTVGVNEYGTPVTSLAVAGLDAYRAAAGESTLVLTEDWALNWPRVQEQILTVLVDQGGEVGITKAECRGNVAERWYEGQVHRGGRDRPAGALLKSTFDTAWTKVLEARSASEDPIVVRSSGEKFVVDPVARRAWMSEHNS